jgi:SAM-dependent methyltransferase
MATKSDFERIAADARLRFEKRLDAADDDATALGWDSRDSMETRFAAAADMYDFAGTTMLDVGCGFGDFYAFLQDRGQAPAEYYGIDISDRILDIARERHPGATFENRNIFLDQFDSRTFDIAVEFGVLNYDLETISNAEYVREYMRRTYEVCDTTLVNCLSGYREGDWEWEEFVHYYSPEKVFGYAQELSRDVTLKHDFEPIPQKEFNIVIK